MQMFVLFFFFKQKTAYEMRISDWSSDVCSSDLSMMGGASIARVALAHGINANQLHNWRWQYRRGDFGPVPQGPVLLPVQIKGASVTRTEEPRVGEEGCRKCRFRWCPDHVKKQTQ